MRHVNTCSTTARVAAHTVHRGRISETRQATGGTGSELRRDPCNPHARPPGGIRNPVKGRGAVGCGAGYRSRVCAVSADRSTLVHIQRLLLWRLSGDSSLPLPARLTFLTGAPGPRGRVTTGSTVHTGTALADETPGNPNRAHAGAARTRRRPRGGSTSLRTSTICCQAKTGRSAGTKAAGTGCTRAHALAPAPSCTARRGIVCTNGTTTVAASCNRRAKPAQR